MSLQNKQKFFDDQEQEISRDGFTTLSVAGEGLSFSYTIGLFRSYHHPEMIVFGLPAPIAVGVLSDIAINAREGTPFDLSRPASRLFENAEAFFVEVPKENFSEYALSAIRYNGGTNFPVFQVVWPSAKNGVYPWDPDADPDFVAMQPLLGQPPP